MGNNPLLVSTVEWESRVWADWTLYTWRKCLIKKAGNCRWHTILLCYQQCNWRLCAHQTLKKMHNQKSTWHNGGCKFCKTWLWRQMWDVGGLFILLNQHCDVSPCSTYPLWCILHPNVQLLSWTLRSWQNIIIFIEADKSEIQEGDQEKLFCFALVRVFLLILNLAFNDQLFMVFAK